MQQQLGIDSIELGAGHCPPGLVPRKDRPDPADVLLRQEPDEEEDEGDGKEKEDDEDENTNDGYSE